MSRLYLLLYKENSWPEPATIIEMIGECTAKIRWSLPFGLKRAEITIRPKNELDLYRRFNDHLGMRVALFGTHYGLHEPICTGWIFEIVPNSNGSLTYVMGGLERRLQQLRTSLPNEPDEETVTTEIIRQVLAQYQFIATFDTADLQHTDTAIGEWAPDGAPIRESIITMLSWSDSNYAIYDFYSKPGRLLSLTKLGPDRPVIGKRIPNGRPDWIIHRKDLAYNSFRFSRHIWDLRNEIQIIESVSGNGNGNGNGNNNNNGGWDGHPGNSSPNGQANGNPHQHTTYDAVIQEPWLSQYTVRNRFGSDEQRDQYAQLMLDIYSRPIQQNAFTISAPTIQNKNGNRQPLWRMLSLGGGTIQIRDLYPHLDLFNIRSNDRLQSFTIVSMDYDSSSNQMRIVPDTEDGRLDMILKRAGLSMGETISVE